MENNQAMVPKFSVKSAGFLFSMGLLCGVLLPSVLLWTCLLYTSKMIHI